MDAASGGRSLDEERDHDGGLAFSLDHLYLGISDRLPVFERERMGDDRFGNGRCPLSVIFGKHCVWPFGARSARHMVEVGREPRQAGWD
jgi:hypothetical protein